MKNLKRKEIGFLEIASETLNGVHVWPSQANLVLFRVANAKATFDQLLKLGILIKCVHGRHPLLDNCLQVTVGIPEENQAFLQALTGIV